MKNEDTFYLPACVIIDGFGRVLLMHRNTDRRTQWELPAGRIDPAEDARAAVAHQLKRELDVDVEVRHLLGEKHFEDEGVMMHFAWFATHIVAGEPKIMDTGIYDGLRYFSVDDLKGMHHELSSSTRGFVQELTRGDIRLAPLS